LLNNEDNDNDNQDSHESCDTLFDIFLD